MIFVVSAIKAQTNIGIWITGFNQELHIMMSSNGYKFRVTGHLCGEFTGRGEVPAQRPVTRSFDVFFDLCMNKRLIKQSRGWWFEMPSRSLWRHCNGYNWQDILYSWLLACWICFDCLKDHQRCIHISNHILHFVQQKKTKFILQQHNMLPTICCQYHACWCPGSMYVPNTHEYSVSGISKVNMIFIKTQRGTTQLYLYLIRYITARLFPGRDTFVLAFAGSHTGSAH